MAAIELDPIFVKALKLLHSKSQESTDKLRDMLNEVLNKRKSKHDSKVSIAVNSEKMGCKVVHNDPGVLL